MSDPAAEKALASIRKKEANKKCADCGADSKFGHGAVTVQYNSFVCHMCKSAHQSFSHHMKSVTMSNWKMSEVAKLKSSAGGGNKICRRKWLAKITPKQLKTYKPSKGDDLDKYKRWIKLIYEDKRWYSSTPRASTGTSGGATKKSPKAAPQAQQPRKPANVLAGFDFGGSDSPKASSAPARATTSQNEFDFFNSPAPVSAKAAPAPAPANAASEFDFFAAQSPAASPTHSAASNLTSRTSSQQSASGFDLMQDFFSSPASTPGRGPYQQQQRQPPAQAWGAASPAANRTNAYPAPAPAPAPQMRRSSSAGSTHGLDNDIMSLYSSGSTGGTARSPHNNTMMGGSTAATTTNSSNSNSNSAGFDFFATSSTTTPTARAATSPSTQQQTKSSSGGGDPFANLGW